MSVTPWELSSSPEMAVTHNSCPPEQGSDNLNIMSQTEASLFKKNWPGMTLKDLIYYINWDLVSFQNFDIRTVGLILHGGGGGVGDILKVFNYLEPVILGPY